MIRAGRPRVGVQETRGHATAARSLLVVALVLLAAAAAAAGEPDALAPAYDVDLQGSDERLPLDAGG